jgi:UDP-glucose 4-epimerase
MPTDRWSSPRSGHTLEAEHVQGRGVAVQQGGRRVLITGISGVLAGRLAARLEADERVAYIGGVDFSEPAQRLTRTEFIRADIRNPLVAKVVDSTRVDTIVHLSISATPGGAGGRSRMKELNVIGTMQLLAAAQKAPAMRRMVVKSSTAVYGSHYADPALFREDAQIGGHGSPQGYAKDAIEVERYARGMARRRPDAALTILRFANLLGAGATSPLTAYFGMPVVPTVFGYDPRLQFCHIDDAVEILHRSALEDHPGTYNVAGRGILYLSQAIRLAGRPSVAIPQPLMAGTAGLLRRLRRVDFSPEQLHLLLYGRVGDISRMRERFGFEPSRSTRETFEDFIASRGIDPLLGPEAVERVEAGLRRALIRSEEPPAAGRPVSVLATTTPDDGAQT